MVAGPSDESFLPQIVGIFYAVFDPHRGPIVPHQVPETLISQPEDLSVSSAALRNGSSRKLSPTPCAGTPARSSSSSPQRAPSRVSKRALSVSPSRTFRSSRRSPSPMASQHSIPYNPTPLITPALIDFASITEHIIPKAALKHRLITCCSGRYKILGFPCLIEDPSYERNEFIFNVCFVFDRLSDLSAFEPVVRKCGRIMRACEIDTRWLSSKETKHNIQSVLEQLHEDLNSYSETSIVLDGINSLDLALFPFYPNPPQVDDWHVPVALVDFQKLKDPNWDITATKILQHIDGVHHVERIAQLADADLDSTRLCIQHFLYYQVITMIDIFQYSNMYMCKPAIQRKARDRTVTEECGMYVTREGFPLPSWPSLARLYSKLIPGLTIHQWMEENGIQAKGIDVRRFVSFGVIKGFLRRVHRWPVYLDNMNNPNTGERRSGFKEKARIEENVGGEGGGRRRSSAMQASQSQSQSQSHSVSGTPGRKDSLATIASNGTGQGLSTFSMNPTNESGFTLRSTALSVGSFGTSPNFGGGVWKAKSDSPMGLQTGLTTLNNNNNNEGGGFPSRLPAAQQLSTSFRSIRGPMSASHNTSFSLPRGTNSSNNSSTTIAGGPRGGRIVRDRERDTRGRPGLKNVADMSLSEQDANLQAAMVGYLDGVHHADELQVRFKIGWARLDAHLRQIAGVPENVSRLSEERREAISRGDYGKVVIVSR